MESKKFELLGSAQNQPPTSPEEATLDTFENKFQKRDYLVEFDCADFTSQCPVTQQSDFANIIIKYIPDQLCIESKSLKYYLQSFRNQKQFNEVIVNTILSDLSEACKPKWMEVRGAFAARGGISLTTTAQYPDLDLID